MSGRAITLTAKPVGVDSVACCNLDGGDTEHNFGPVAELADAHA